MNDSILERNTRKHSIKNGAPRSAVFLNTSNDARHRDHRRHDHLGRCRAPLPGHHDRDRHHGHRPTKARCARDCRENHGVARYCHGNGCRPSHNQAGGPAGNSAVVVVARNSAQVVESNNAPAAQRNSVAGALHRCAVPGKWACIHRHRHRRCSHTWWVTQSPGIRSSNQSLCSNLQDSA